MNKKMLRCFVYPVVLLLLVIFTPVHANQVQSPLGGTHTAGTILYVKTSGSSTECTSWADACGLQTALSKAASGDQVWVAAGTYKPTTGYDREATFALKSGVSIYGGFPDDGGEWETRDWEANPTILNGNIGSNLTRYDNSYHVLTGDGVDSTAILDGFTVINGNANGSEEPHYYGGGMYNAFSNPTLTNVNFKGNTAEYGGGMANIVSNPVLTQVSFSENGATLDGGGMYNYASSPTFLVADFSENYAEEGGGIYNLYSSPSLTGLDVYDNFATAAGGGIYNLGSSPTLTTASFYGNASEGGGGGMVNNDSSPTLTDANFSGNTAEGRGGGMYNDENSSPTLTEVTFSSNMAYLGGGMSNYQSSPTLTDVTFNGNEALGEFSDGGGMSNSWSSPSLSNVLFVINTSARDGGGMSNYQSSPTLTNVTFSSNTAENDGGGMYNYWESSPDFTNVTFSGNTAGEDGGGIYSYNECYPTLRSSILWANTPDQIYDLDGETSITYSAVQNGYPGTGNIYSDPRLFVLADNGSFTKTHALAAGSPAIDAGDPANCPATDQRGNIRPIDGNGDGIARCDMGAYEFGYTLSVNSVGGGTVGINPQKTEYFFGEMVTLTANPETGWSFTGWSRDASGTANPLSITMDASKTITATFTQDTYSLTVTISPTGKGSVAVDPAKASYHYGDEVSLTASANNGWSFTNWSGDASGTANPLTLRLYSNKKITANFISEGSTLYLPLLMK